MFRRRALAARRGRTRLGGSPERLQRSPSSMKLYKASFARVCCACRNIIRPGGGGAAAAALRHRGRQVISLGGAPHRPRVADAHAPLRGDAPSTSACRCRWCTRRGRWRWAPSRWRAYLILLAMLSVGVPLPLSSAGGCNSRGGGRWRRGCTGRRARRRTSTRCAARSVRPVRSCFLLMWAPLPTSTLPLLVGFLIPPSELSLADFVCGALPSKLLHFSADVLVGIGRPARRGARRARRPAGRRRPRRRRREQPPPRRIAVGTMGLTVFFVAGMFHTMHSALKECARRRRARLLGSPV